jgi:hypothetical protein
MDWVYPLKYSDQRGIETAEIRNDGSKLSVRLRRINFSGRDFDALNPASDSLAEVLTSFTLCRGSLCDCVIECEIPVPLLFDSEMLHGNLQMHLELGSERPNGALDREVLSLSIAVAGHAYRSSGKTGWFEGELVSLHSALPTGVYLVACINCAYSDYSPYGHGLFGGMACFRNFKRQYASVRSKADLFPILNSADVVQETYLCPEFEKRRPRTGYRG